MLDGTDFSVKSQFYGTRTSIFVLVPTAVYPGLGARFQEIICIFSHFGTN